MKALSAKFGIGQVVRHRKYPWLMMDCGVMAWRPVGAGDVDPGAVCGLD